MTQWSVRFEANLRSFSLRRSTQPHVEVVKDRVVATSYAAFRTWRAGRCVPSHCFGWVRR